MRKPSSSIDFESLFGENPEWCVHAPGRVNLIGDHTDYNGLPVFPMAIQRCVTIIGRTRPDDLVRVTNRDSEFGPVEFKLEANMIPGPSGSWENYVKAGTRAVADEWRAKVGFDALISSDIPVAAGLSSSSALVVACGLATCRANGLSLPLTTMADLMAGAERFVGTQGGGMDQAACLGGKQGSAVRIDFAPLRWQLVDVPTDWRFVVAHTLVRAEKSAAVQGEYNQRVTDCRLAFERVSRVLNQPDAPAINTYSELLAAHDVETVLETANDELIGKLLARFRHTVTESGRVDHAVHAMRELDRTLFGDLMIASHESLRHDFDVSVPELDELVSVMMASGCDGARLTGAGFGGCVVGLCSADVVDRVIESIISGFYGFSVTPSDLDQVLFIAEPSDGAGVRA